MPQEKRARASPEAGGTPAKQQQSKPAPRAAAAAMPVVGDLLEAIYAEGCWVPARAIGVRSAGAGAHAADPALRGASCGDGHVTNQRHSGGERRSGWKRRRDGLFIQKACVPERPVAACLGLAFRLY